MVRSVSFDNILSCMNSLYADLTHVNDKGMPLIDGVGVTSPRGMKTHEIRNLQIELTNPSDCLLVNTGRRLSATLAVAEALQLIGGFSDPETTVRIAPHYENFMDDSLFHGAYGNRTGAFMEDVVNKLKDDPDSRQAVVTMWHNELDLLQTGKHDYPCTVYMNFAVRDGQLLMTTHMRSNDAWLGWPYDVVQFTSLQRTVARFLGIECGAYVHNVDSFHMYERDFEKAKIWVQDNYIKQRPRPTLEGGIGVSYFLDNAEPELKDWTDVQNRAHDIFYFPGSVLATSDNLSEEEQYMCGIMQRFWEKTQ